VAYRIYRFSHQFTVDDACSLLVQHSNGVYTVGDFMTGRDNLHVVQPSTPVDQGTCPYRVTLVVHLLHIFFPKLLTSAVSLCAALELLVQHKISGLPVVDDDGKLVSLL
jgi:CBS domain-containing protein